MMNSKPPRRGVPQPISGGPQRFGPYLLEARLAVGGTSEVYLARLDPAADAARAREDRGTQPDRLVVKRLLPHLVADPEGRTMFEREAVLHAAVSHPNVVTVFGTGTTAQGEPYLAMEYIDGCDAFRLLRRATHERAALPVPVSVFIAREVLRGLAAVHRARDASGAPLGIIHRDVTPSNVYLSLRGAVKVGDFGIARSSQRSVAPRAPNAPGAELRPQDATLLGKFSYLAPEQVAGDPFDHRADLFSLATVLTELLIGKPLFPGTGQLQVLLAIRDCRLDPLLEARPRLPPGLFPVLEKALSRDPSQRFPDADAFSAALAPFLADAAHASRELAARVASVQSVTSESSLHAVRESARAMRAVRLDSSLTPVVSVSPPAPSDPEIALDLDLDLELDVVEDATAEAPDAHLRDTGIYPQFEAFVQRPNGERSGPWTFAELVEAIASGIVIRGDKVAYVGVDSKPIEEIPELAKLLPKALPPPEIVTTQAIVPSYAVDLAQTTMLDVLAYVLERRESGLLVMTRGGRDGRPVERREAHFLRGKLHHIAGHEESERLGEALVRQGKLSREELDMALAVLPRYRGRLGDTLIGLGLVDGVDVFRALREQGRERLSSQFRWADGAAEFLPGAVTPAVDFPLDLELPALMLAGIEASHPGDAPLAFLEAQLDVTVIPHPRGGFAGVTWPPSVAAVIEALTHPMPIRTLVASVVVGGRFVGADVARALEILFAVDLARGQ